jgi:hypothetical protein
LKSQALFSCQKQTGGKVHGKKDPNKPNDVKTVPENKGKLKDIAAPNRVWGRPAG